MKKGKLEYAIRMSLNHFDDWNDSTGYFPKASGYYYEIQSVIEDAVKIGSKIACEGIDADISDILK